jgi:L-ascorbate 6-phosphate lactonase
MSGRKYNYTQNDPFDKQGKIKLVLEREKDSQAFMEAIKSFSVPENGLAVWFLGQNGFILKSGRGPLLAIDPYLTNSCASLYKKNFEFRLDRQLPVFIEPEHFAVDLILLTHSHDDHCDSHTLKRYGQKQSTKFISPWEGYQKLIQAAVPEKNCYLIHPNQALEIGGVNIRGTFALPTDYTDLNHLGYLIRFANGITFYNSGDTAYCDLFTHLNVFKVDICTICINGGFHNLNHMDAARIVKDINPQIVIPCHYDMMVNNVGNPEMFRTALQVLSVRSQYQQLAYYQPWVYLK